MHKELLQRVSLYIEKMRAPRLLRGAEGFTHRTNDRTGPFLRRCDRMSREALAKAIAHPATELNLLVGTRSAEGQRIAGIALQICGEEAEAAQRTLAFGERDAPRLIDLAGRVLGLNSQTIACS